VPASPTPNPVELGPALDEMATSTDRLLATVDRLDDAGLREPSLLPGWSRAHVLTHIARNADGLVNLATWARTGEETPMYPGGQAGRAADIEAGVARHIGDVRLDLSDSAERLLGAFADFPDDGLTRGVVFGAGRAAGFGWEIPLMRTREVEIHHVDLDGGYTPAHWSEGFVHRTLDQLAPFFRSERDMPVGRLAASDSDRSWEVAADGPALTGPTNALLAWLTGRSTGDGLQLDTGDPVPMAPTWR
jgi:maleylpyruvate isomerase